MAESAISVLELMDRLYGWFRGPSWDAWRALVASLFGLPLTPEQLATYQKHTGRTVAPTAQAREAYVVAGRRAGKSLVAALVALWAAVFRNYAGILAPGERGVVMIIASDRQQAKVIFRYLLGFFDAAPGLTKLIQRRTQEALHLSNAISIEIYTCSFRAVRGRTVVAFVADELAFWRDELSANPDVEVLNAIRPSQATVREPIFLCISSPYARRGALWEGYSRHYGRDGDPVFVWAADTKSMNPLVPDEVIAQAFEADEAVASAEYGRDGVISFRRDIEGFISREIVESVVMSGRALLPPISSTRYVAFCDPAGGTGADSFTLAIAHGEDRDGRAIAVLDLVEERKPPFSPETTVKEYAGLLAVYNVRSVMGDRYAGEWPREQFRKCGIEYELAEKTKSDLYRDCLPLLTSGAAELLDLPRLQTQLLGLERRTARGGRDSIDHQPQGHDDVINSAAGALVLAADDAGREPMRVW